DRRETAGGYFDRITAKNAEAHWIALRHEVVVERRVHADPQRHGAQIVEERAFVERMRYARTRRLRDALFVVFDELEPVGKDLVVALRLVAALVDVLVVAQRRERIHREPILVAVIHLVEEIAATEMKQGVPRLLAAHRVHRQDFHVAIADVEMPEADVVLHALADAERRADSLAVLGRGLLRALLR